MKTKLLLFLFGLLLAVGCATTDTPKENIHERVIKADNDWKEFNRLNMPKMHNAAIVRIERGMYEKARRRSGAKEWEIRLAGWRYVRAVNEARIPDIPQPPGRGSVQPNPFQ